MMISSTLDQQGNELTELTFFLGTFSVPSQWVAWAIAGLLFIVLPLVGYWVARRLDRRLDPRGDQVPDQLTGSAAVSDYLSRLAAALHLPAGIGADLSEEVAAHIADTVDGLQAEGLDHDEAVRRSLAGLGSPISLAASLDAVQQTRRRLFAGVGGGVFGAASGVFAGFWVGVATVLPAYLVAMVAGLLLADVISRGDPTGAFTMLGQLVVVFASAYAARQGVRMTAALSRRPVQDVGRIWAVAGGLLVTWLVLFVVEQPQGWMRLPLELALPVAFMVGALVRVDRPWPTLRPRDRIAVALALGMGAVILATAFGLARVDTVYDGAVPGIERVAPAAAASLVPQGEWLQGRPGMGARCSRDADETVTCRFDARADDMGTTLDPRWHDLRLELWPASVDEYASASGVAPGATTPLLAAVASVTGDEVIGAIDIGERRDGAAWWLTLTGIGPDGERYRLSDGAGVAIPFQGTVWDWLTAPG